MKLNDVPQSLLIALDALHGVGDAWPDPQPVARNLAPVEPFREELLPGVFRRRVFDVAHRMQCPPEFVAIPMMVMFGSLIGTGCGVHPKQNDDWIEMPNLWGGVVAPPGALKSPAMSQALRPLRRVDSRAAADHSAALTSFTQNKLARELDRKQLEQKLKKGARSSEDTKKFFDLSTELEPPQLRRFHTQDATVEKLGELLSANPRGLLTARDELVGWLASLDRAGRENERSFYLEGWNGTLSFTTDRIGRGTIHIPRACVSVLGGIQPGRLNNYLYDANSNHNDGLIQRFQLLVFPDCPAMPLIVDERHDEDALEAVMRVAERLAYCDFASLGALVEDRGGQPQHYLRFSLDAQAIFNEWLACLHRKIQVEEMPIMKEHFSKFRKLVPALSLILHLVDAAATSTPTHHITPAALEPALAWASYLESHARRIYGICTDYDLLAAERLAKEIKIGSLEGEFSERHVQRRNWHYLDTKEMVQAACRELQEAGWIRRVDTAAAHGRPASPTYKINPKARG